MLISVITINYNNLEGLKKTVESVFEQTFKNVEYIVVDGGSTDGSKAYIESKADSIAHWVSEPDTGVYNAMNKGVKKATGDYLLFLNSGDHFYNSQALAEFLPYTTSHPDKAILYGNIQVIGETEWIKTYPDTLSFAYFVKHAIPHPATLIKRSCFKELFYDEKLKIVADWKLFIILICERNYSYLHIDHIISTFYMDGISSTQSHLVKEERRKVLENDFSMQLQAHKEKQALNKKAENSSNKSIVHTLVKKIFNKLK